MCAARTRVNKTFPKLCFEPTFRSILEVVAIIPAGFLSGLRIAASYIFEAVRSLQALRSKEVYQLWLKKSVSLLLGSLAYNLFVILILVPILRLWFPPLSGWEHVRSFFTGTHRSTYQDLLPYVGPAIWILGNGFWFALLSRNLKEARQEGGREHLTQPSAAAEGQQLSSKTRLRQGTRC